MIQQTSKQTISAIAISTTTFLEIFNRIRVDCDHHAMNDLTKAHNCFYGDTKKECNAVLCPLKKKET